MSDKSPTPFTFIDLFAGIGGIRLAMESAGGECVMTSEWDRWARISYETFFGIEDHFVGDITAVEPTDVPDHDVLCGGFPCQPFSLAGVSKKNALGRAHGFDDPTQGTLFFNIKEILREKQPSAFLLENVKNLKSHDRGRTWKVISESLAEVGYVFSEKIIDAARVVPQHRERVFIVGYRRDLFGGDTRPRDFTSFWSAVDIALDEQADAQRQRYRVRSAGTWPRVGAIMQPERDVEDRYTLTENMWAYLQAYRAKHEALGNGFGYGLVDAKTPYTRTLSARYYKDGSEVLVSRGKGERPRRLTPLECLRLQGFPRELEVYYDGRQPQPVSDTQAYKQFGNSVAVPVVTAVASVLRRYLAAPHRLAELPVLVQHLSAAGARRAECSAQLDIPYSAAE